MQLKCYKGHSAEVLDCQSNEDSSQFVSCSNDKSIIVWDVESGKILRRFRGLVAPFTSVCYGPDSATALAGSLDGAVRVYDLRAVNAYEPIQTLSEASDSVTCCRVHKQMVFTTSLDKSLRTYDIRNGLLDVDAMGRPLNHVSVSADGGLLLVSCLRGATILVDRRGARVVNEFAGNENKLFKIESTFALKDSLVCAGSEDARCYVWRTQQSQAHEALEHAQVKPPIIQSISCDSLDGLLTACGSYLFMWSLSVQ